MLGFVQNKPFTYAGCNKWESRVYKIQLACNFCDWLYR